MPEVRDLLQSGKFGTFAQDLAIVATIVSVQAAAQGKPDLAWDWLQLGKDQIPGTVYSQLAAWICGLRSHERFVEDACDSALEQLVRAQQALPFVRVETPQMCIYQKQALMALSTREFKAALQDFERFKAFHRYVVSPLVAPYEAIALWKLGKRREAAEKLSRRPAGSPPAERVYAIIRNAFDEYESSSRSFESRIRKLDESFEVARTNLIASLDQRISSLSAQKSGIRSQISGKIKKLEALGYQIQVAQTGAIVGATTSGYGLYSNDDNMAALGLATTIISAAAEVERKRKAEQVLGEIQQLAAAANRVGSEMERVEGLRRAVRGRQDINPSDFDSEWASRYAQLMGQKAAVQKAYETYEQQAPPIAKATDRMISEIPSSPPPLDLTEAPQGLWEVTRKRITWQLLRGGSFPWFDSATKEFSPKAMVAADEMITQIIRVLRRPDSRSASAVERVLREIAVSWRMCEAGPSRFGTSDLAANAGTLRCSPQFQCFLYRLPVGSVFSRLLLTQEARAELREPLLILCLRCALAHQIAARLKDEASRRPYWLRTADTLVHHTWRPPKLQPRSCSWPVAPGTWTDLAPHPLGWVFLRSGRNWFLLPRLGEPRLVGALDSLAVDALGNVYATKGHQVLVAVDTQWVPVLAVENVEPGEIHIRASQEVPGLLLLYGPKRKSDSDRLTELLVVDMVAGTVRKASVPTKLDDAAVTRDGAVFFVSEGSLFRLAKDGSATGHLCKMCPWEQATSVSISGDGMVIVSGAAGLGVYAQAHGTVRVLVANCRGLARCAGASVFALTKADQQLRHLRRLLRRVAPSVRRLDLPRKRGQRLEITSSSDLQRQAMLESMVRRLTTDAPHLDDVAAVLEYAHSAKHYPLAVMAYSIASSLASDGMLRYDEGPMPFLVGVYLLGMARSQGATYPMRSALLQPTYGERTPIAASRLLPRAN